jgi:hypothetical protein
MVGLSWMERPSLMAIIIPGRKPQSRKLLFAGPRSLRARFARRLVAGHGREALRFAAVEQPAEIR